MLSIKASHILTVVVSFCGLQLCGQGLDPRAPMGAARTAARRTLARQPASNQIVTAAVSLPQAPGTFISFDAPGACAIASFPGCMDAAAINPAGAVLGYSIDTSGNSHGYLRDSKGTFTRFDVPGVLNFIGSMFLMGPPGSSLNPAGEATGGYFDTNGPHGFIRDNHGVVTTFDAPGAVNGTIPLSINAAGEVTGYYFDANFLGHGFLREANGNVTEFDAPGSGAPNCLFFCAFPTGINAAGAITGWYYDPQFIVHGFLRERNGAFTVIDVPNSLGASPLTINDGGEIAGIGGPADGDLFIRDPSGSFTVFNVPGVSQFLNMDINSPGVVAGSYFDDNVVTHSFRRTPDGTLTSIDFPGAGTVSVPLPGTQANSINAAGEITGFYSDANGVTHGFLFLPPRQ